MEDKKMSVKMRLTRMGDKKSPFYRIVVIDSRKARDGQYIDLVGTYNPLTEPATIKINEEKAKALAEKKAAEEAAKAAAEAEAAAETTEAPAEEAAPAAETAE